MGLTISQLFGQGRIVDAGRRGHRHQAIPEGGFADVESASFANRLVGNSPTSALLEFDYGGVELVFHEATLVACTGAEVSCVINSEESTVDTSLEIRAGDRLKLGNCKSGFRLYLAIAGGVVSRAWMDSQSPCLLGAVPYPADAVLQKGTSVAFGKRSIAARTSRSFSKPLLLHQCLSVQPAPETHWLDQHFGARELVEQTHWQVSAQSNRMGIRLHAISGSTELLARLSVPGRSSVPVLPGTIQCLPQGDLIITHVDGQTVGGYPRIGLVDRAGLNQLAQCFPGRSTLRLGYQG